MAAAALVVAALDAQFCQGAAAALEDAAPEAQEYRAGSAAALDDDLQPGLPEKAAAPEEYQEVVGDAGDHQLP